MNILFWNIAKNSVANYVAKCASEYRADVICLAEHQGTDPNDLCKRLDGKFRWISGPYSQDKKVILFAKDTTTYVPSGQLLEQNRYLIWSFACEGVEYNIAALHMVDRKSEPDPHARIHDARRVMADLRLREKHTGCSNSIVIGDFNADPFGEELTTMDAFNAVLFKDVIRAHPVRRRAGEEFPMLYNPALHYLSEESKCYGSFYFGKGFADIYWHCYDQALVSEPLVDAVINIQYIRAIGGEQLVQKAGPLAKISDHLPLILSMRGKDHV